MFEDVRSKTLRKFLRLNQLTKDRNIPLSLNEIIQELGCCKSTAYNYRKALDHLYPLQEYLRE